MEPVLGLIEDDRRARVDDLVGDLVAAVRGQAVWRPVDFGVVVNSGCANACTGLRGLEVARLNAGVATLKA